MLPSQSPPTPRQRTGARATSHQASPCQSSLLPAGAEPRPPNDATRQAAADNADRTAAGGLALTHCGPPAAQTAINLQTDRLRLAIGDAAVWTGRRPRRRRCFNRCRTKLGRHVPAHPKHASTRQRTGPSIDTSQLTATVVRTHPLGSGVLGQLSTCASAGLGPSIPRSSGTVYSRLCSCVPHEVGSGAQLLFTRDLMLGQ